jgi:hypothetical protein
MDCDIYYKGKFDVNHVIIMLEKWQAGLDQKKVTLIKRIFENKVPCFVLGCNENSSFISKHIYLDGFIDDFVSLNTQWQGLPVVRGEELPSDAIVINAALHRRPHQALERLRKLPNCAHILHYCDFTRTLPKHCPPLPFVDEARSVFFKYINDFVEITSRFADLKSHRVLYDILLYRLTGDPNFTKSYTVRNKEQYFDVPLNFSEAPVFVDGGSYDGETTELFCNYYPNYNSCYLFEPNERSMDLARKRLQNYSNIYFLLMLWEINMNYCILIQKQRLLLKLMIKEKQKLRLCLWMISLIIMLTILS